MNNRFSNRQNIFVTIPKIAQQMYWFRYSNNTLKILVHLVLPLSEARYRIENRQDHFFSAKLIESQYDALEAPTFGEQIIEVDATLSVGELLKSLPATMGNS